MAANPTYTLDKRLKIFKSHDSSLWVYWVDRTKDTSASGSTTTSSITKITGIAQYTGNETPSSFYTVEELPSNKNVLCCTKSTNRTFDLPTDKEGTITPNLFWAGYFDSNIYKPIYNIKYYDMFYDTNQDTIDLIFWTNVVVADLPSIGTVSSITQFGQFIGGTSVTPSSTITGIDLYPTYTCEENDTTFTDGEGQRCIFYSHADLKDCALKLSDGSILATSMFFFSKPVLLICTGINSDGSSDTVTDEIPSFRFLELQ
jgi:hypothetical protein